MDSSKQKGPPAAKVVFECQRCNTCCTGQGGIYLKPEQAPGAAAELGMGEDEFIERFCRPRDGLYEIICNDQGACALLGPEGCTIHAHKPEICRRWPFFPGMLKHPGALEEAKLACPGIAKDATHAEFLAAAKKELGLKD